jgi:hypothetical protein
MDDDMSVNAEEEMAHTGGGGGGGCLDMPIISRLEPHLRDLEVKISQEDLSGGSKELFTRWFSTVSETADMRTCAYESFGLDPKDLIDPAVLKTSHDREWERVVGMYYRLLQAGAIDPADKENAVGQRFVRMIEIIDNLYDMIMLDQRIRVAADPSFAGSSGTSVLSTFRYALVDHDNTNSVQELLLFTLQAVYKLNYRKFEDRLYEQILTESDKLPTRAWREVISIQDFIYQIAVKEVAFDQWKNMTAARDNVGAATKYLIKCRDFELPFLKANRHMFSFVDGVYDARTRTWHPHRDDPNPLPSGAVACNYFVSVMGYDEFAGVDNMEPTFSVDEESGKRMQDEDGSFLVSAMVHAPTRDWRNIPTPNFCRILDDQELPAAVKDWVFVMMGRLLYEIGDKDEWQVIPFFKGKAGTGKSTICKIMFYIYGRDLMGVLSNNIEKKFGLSAFRNKLAYIGPEIKADLDLDQAQLQSMITGESMSIPVKNETAIDNFDWKSHGMLAGNELPRWVDNSGSMSRRIVMFEFTKKVRNGDPKLMMRIKTETGPLLVKINAAYMEATSKFGNKDIWDVLPPYFKDMQKKLRSQMHSLASFLSESQQIELCDSAYMPESEFKDVLKRYVESNNMTRKTWSAEYYESIFEEWNLRVEHSTLRYDAASGKDAVRNWIVGARLRQDGAVGALAPPSAAAPGSGDDYNLDDFVPETTAQRAILRALSKGVLRVQEGSSCSLETFRRVTSLACVTPSMLQGLGMRLEKQERDGSGVAETWVLNASVKE